MVRFWNSVGYRSGYKVLDDSWGRGSDPDFQLMEDSRIYDYLPASIILPISFSVLLLRVNFWFLGLWPSRGNFASFAMKKREEYAKHL